MATFTSEWYSFPFDSESELIEIRARHYGIAQLDIYIKLFTDTSFPYTPTVSITPATLGLATTSFPTNLIFHRSLFGTYNPEYVRIVATGDGAVSASLQIIGDISFKIEPKRERMNNG